MADNIFDERENIKRTIKAQRGAGKPPVKKPQKRRKKTNPIAKALKFFTATVVPDKKKYKRKEKHVQKNFWSIRNVSSSD